MEKISEIAVSILLSSFAGLCIGGFTSFVYAENIYPGIIEGLVLGALIGICSRYIFKLIYAKLRKKFILALLSVLAIIALMTGVACALWKVPFPSPFLYVMIISQFTGVVTTIFIFQYIQKLNNKLIQKQQELESGR